MSTATLTKPITVTDVMEALEAVVAEADWGIDTRRKDEYRDRDGDAHCIAACVVQKLAPFALGLLTEGHEIDREGNRDLLLECGFTVDAVTVLRVAQMRQDDHQTWGIALNAAGSTAKHLSA